jgi:hypothetical protein
VERGEGEEMLVKGEGNDQEATREIDGKSAGVGKRYIGFESRETAPES